ncbi:MAG: ribosome recycling factor [Bacteroidota bacterium]
MEDLEEALELVQMEMEESIVYLNSELAKVRAGKASPSMLSGIMVEYYGSPTPLSQVSNVSTPDGRTISIKPWEKGIIGNIEKAIFAANLGLTPQNNGEVIIINIPALTEERRRVLVKQAKQLGEDAKVSLRSARHKGMDAIKKAVKDGYPEDAGKRKEDKVQKDTNGFGDKVNQLVAAKEKDIMTV